MIISSAKFVKSSPSLKECPRADKPEFAFIGRSNVGKSSLINMLTGFHGLAKTSGQPGKTRTINHFIVNDSWYIVDLPGYGYAKVSATLRDKWVKATENYIVKRENLVCIFVLLDPRIAPQASDLKFMEFLGLNNVPLARIFTKSDKISASALAKTVAIYDSEMLETWEELPPTFYSSATKKYGREEILQFIGQCLNNFSTSR